MSNKTESLTTRVPIELKRLVKLRAASRCQTLARYVRDKLESANTEPLPMLAALGRIIAIHAIVERDPSQAAATLAELRSLVEKLSLLAHAEVTR